jgi:hypothetical protein
MACKIISENGTALVQGCLQENKLTKKLWFTSKNEVGGRCNAAAAMCRPWALASLFISLLHGGEDILPKDVPHKVRVLSPVTPTQNSCNMPIP